MPSYVEGSTDFVTDNSSAVGYRWYPMSGEMRKRHCSFTCGEGYIPEPIADVRGGVIVGDADYGSINQTGMVPPGNSKAKGRIIMAQERGSCNEGSSCGTCDNSSTCSPEEREAHERERLERRLGGIRHKLMIMSGKGGVGKTTVAINLGVILAMEGLKVGLLDADIHGPNVPKMLGVELKSLNGTRGGLRPIEVLPNLHTISMAYLIGDRDNPVVWRGPLKHSAISQFISEVEWGPLDYFIVDLPPGTGDEPLSVAHLIRNVNGSIIVTTPQDVALLDSRKSVNFSRVLKIPVTGIVENMSGMTCPHCGKDIPLFKIGGGERAAKELNVPFLGRIPIDPEMVQNCDRGMPYVMSHPNSEATKAFQAIATHCKEYVENKPAFGIQRAQTQV
jgi:Mrp family chromosome partitioning ATPase